MHMKSCAEASTKVAMALSRPPAFPAQFRWHHHPLPLPSPFIAYQWKWVFTESSFWLKKSPWWRAVRRWTRETLGFVVAMCDDAFGDALAVACEHTLSDSVTDTHAKSQWMPGTASFRLYPCWLLWAQASAAHLWGAGDDMSNAWPNSLSVLILLPLCLIDFPWILFYYIFKNIFLCVSFPFSA